MRSGLKRRRKKHEDGTHKWSKLKNKHENETKQQKLKEEKEKKVGGGYNTKTMETKLGRKKSRSLQHGYRGEGKEAVSINRHEKHPHFLWSK